MCAVVALAGVAHLSPVRRSRRRGWYELRMRSEARDLDAAKAMNAPAPLRPAGRSHLVVFQRIVCGVDGSPEGLEALRQAALLRAPEGRLVAVTVFDASPAAGTGLGAARLTVKRREDAKEASDEALRVIGDVPFADAQQYVLVSRGHSHPVAARKQACLS